MAMTNVAGKRMISYIGLSDSATGAGVLVALVASCGAGMLKANQPRPVPIVETGSIADGSSVKPGTDVSEYTAPKGMVMVPAGKFWMGCAPSETRRECGGIRGREVFVDTFYIGKTEVTVARYSNCVQAGACTSEHLNEQTIDGKTFSKNKNCNWGHVGRDHHPINCVNWYQAKAFCSWIGKQLPTEAQWEKAARGSDRRIYPWGNQEPTCEYAIMDMGCGRDSTWPVGALPRGASPYGVLDASGNVYEWTVDWYDADHKTFSSPRDLASPPDGSVRIFRGGSWVTSWHNKRFLQVTDRCSFEPYFRNTSVGIRCVLNKVL